MFQSVRTLGLILAAAVLLSLPLAASADRLQTRELAYAAMEAYNKKGFSVRDIQIGVMLPGDPYYMDTQMTAGVEYVIAAGGDENLKGVSILIYDENWMPVAKSQEGATTEIVFKPKWTGAYHVKITWKDFEKERAYWYVVSGYK